MAGAYVQRPGPVNMRAGNVEVEWNRFKQKFEIFLIATAQANLDQERKWAVLMQEAGDEALEIYNAFKSSLVTRAMNAENQEVVTDNSRNYEAVTAAFDTYAAQKKNLTLLRERFMARNQRAKEPLLNWLTDLKNLIKPCEYCTGEDKTLEDSLIKDRLVLGLNNKRLKDTLKGRPQLTLQEVIDTIKAVEENVEQNAQEQDMEVDTLHLKKSGRNPQQKGMNNHKGFKQHKSCHTAPYKADKRTNWSRGRGRGGRGGSHKGQTRRLEQEYQCKKCDTRHGPRNCPAHGKQCHACQGWGHYSRVCKQGKGAVKMDSLQVTKKTQEENYILEGWDEKQADTITMLELNVQPVETAEDDDVSGEVRQRKEHTEVIRIGGQYYIKFKLDNGSEANILPLEIFLKINKDKKYTLTKRNIVLKGFGRQVTTIEGSVNLLTEARHGDSMVCEFLITKAEDRPILGIEACEQLNLVKRVIHTLQVSKTLPESKKDFIQKYEELFSGLGKFRQTVKIEVDPNAPTGMCPPRRYSFSINQRLEGKLKSLESRGVIAKVTDKLPKFISNLVIREKGDGDLRLCLDPENLNKAIVRQNYPIPTLEELTSKVRDKKYFTVLDLKDGFWHATLDPDSSELCSFTTPYGVYKFLKLPFGVKCAPEIFQFLNDQAFTGTGSLIYFDDCLIAGETLEEHDNILSAVMERAKREVIRFNPHKLQYRKLEVMFLGLLWSLNKIKVDPERIAAIQTLSAPSTRKQLQKRMGVFNHLRKFIPQMATIAAPLFALMSEKVHYQWLPIHAEAFQELKDSICRAPALAPFDSTKAIIVQADASQLGMGACMMQGGKLVAAASRQLTVHEQNWAQIEKEMLALTYAAQKFDKFIYGMPEVLFQTDHQPLVSIFKKPIFKITNNRIKKMRLKMLKYQPVVEYIPGKYLYLADWLSRDFLKGPVKDDPEMVEIVHEVTIHLPISNEIKEDFKRETAKDAGLQAVKNYYYKGWPRNNKNVVPDARPYWKVKDDLFEEEGLVILENKIVVPISLRKKVLSQLHLAHLGADKTKARARQFVYWPGITNDINTLTGECRICERHSAANYKEPLIPHAIPQLRFQKVSCDILTRDSQPYLVVEDNLSKWLEIKPLAGKSSSNVIDALRPIFSTHGIPEEIFGDNNPLNSYECHEYARSLGSTINTSSPLYSRSNGLAEKGVDIASKLIQKCKEDGTHLLDALRDYNNTPLSGMQYSPSQILMSRICRTLVPSLQVNLEPKLVDIRPILQQKQDKVKRLHDKHARRKPVHFEPGDKIVFRKGKRWLKGVVVRKHPAPRSYIIRQLSGRCLRRNTFHLKHSKTKPDVHDEYLDQYDLYDMLPCPQAMENAAQRDQRAPNPAHLEQDHLLLGPQHPEGPAALQPLNPGRGRGRGRNRGQHRVLTGRVTRRGREVRTPVRYLPDS